MRPTTEECLSECMTIPPSLLPHTAELVAGMDPLGGDEEHFLRRLLPFLPAGGSGSALVLDLACGKATLSRRLARHYPHWSFFLVDACGPLLEEARRLVGEEQHPARFSFLQSDIRDFAAPSSADLVLLLGVGSVFAPIGEVYTLCARHARSGALVMVDDCVTKDGLAPAPGAPPHLATAHRGLVEAGAEILVEEVLHEEKINRGLLVILGENARRLARRHPELRADLQIMMRQQEEETRRLETELDTILWILKTP